MRSLAFAATLAAAAFGPAVAMTAPEELRGLVRAERPAGCSDYSFLVWDLYRAELWSDHEDLPGDAFALSLTYRSEFSQSELVDSSLDEMARIASRPASTFAGARAEMEQAFRDVSPGDRITAWRAGDDRLRLFVNGRETGALTNGVDVFLGIWLDAGTRHPEGRADLLSGRCDG